mmetsp:Transcript_2991/g.6431  ORF Transcript_2991/g.6431 Transcript_2991/m.6431 type:complete len:215 (+) Transcript_2991:376-1020(+)
MYVAAPIFFARIIEPGVPFACLKLDDLTSRPLSSSSNSALYRAVSSCTRSLFGCFSDTLLVRSAFFFCCCSSSSATFLFEIASFSISVFIFTSSSSSPSLLLLLFPLSLLLLLFSPPSFLTPFLPSSLPALLASAVGAEFAGCCCCCGGGGARAAFFSPGALMGCIAPRSTPSPVYPSKNHGCCLTSAIVMRRSGLLESSRSQRSFAPGGNFLG